MAKLAETEACGTKCPLRRTLAVIEGKYTPLILKELFTGKKRFGQLRRLVNGISPKTLSDKLKDLTEKGVVERISYAEVPPKVEYRLTFRGQRIKGIVQQLQEFWEQEADDPAADESNAGRPTQTGNSKQPGPGNPALVVRRVYLMSQSRQKAR